MTNSCQIWQASKQVVFAFEIVWQKMLVFSTLRNSYAYNSIPSTLKECRTTGTFKILLKTHLYNVAYKTNKLVPHAYKWLVYIRRVISYKYLLIATIAKHTGLRDDAKVRKLITVSW